MDTASKKNRTNDGRYFIFNNPDHYELYGQLSSLPDWEKGTQLLNEKRFTVKDSDASYRIVNYWTSLGLLDDDRDNHSKEWRKFSLRDLLWLRVLRELRKFGLSLDKIHVVYTALFIFNNQKSYWRLDLAMRLCMSTQPWPIFLVIFEDGYAEIATLHDLRITDSIVGYQHPYLRINLNTLCCEMLGNENCMPPLFQSDCFSSEEIELINDVRDGGLDELHIRFKQGNIDRIDRTKRVEGAQKIVDILRETQFGEITVQVHDGRAVQTTITKKTRPQK